jgi:hypothetical protein
MLKKLKNITKPDFTHLNTGDACLKVLVDNFPGSENKWKWKSTDEKDGVTVRTYDGPMHISAAVIFNPNALEEKYVHILDTSGNYDMNKYDPSKFLNKEPTQKQYEKNLMSHAMPKKLTKEEKKKLNEEIKAAKKAQPKQPKLTKKDKEEIEKLTGQIVTDHNLGVLNCWFILKQDATKDRQHITDVLDSMGVMYVLTEVTQQLLHGSEEFASVNTKEQEKVTTLAVECMAEDGTLIRMRIGDYIAVTYRKV